VKWAQWDKTQSIALRWWECGLFREAQHLAECHGVAVHTLWVHQRRLVFCQASGVRDTGSRSADYLAEAYYRINVYYPAINSVSSDIQLQFGSPQLLAFSLSLLLSRRFVDQFSEQWEQLEDTNVKYSSLLQALVGNVKKEYRYILWRQQWALVASEECPDTAIGALTTCDPAKLTNDCQLLLIFGTLPVTTCESERVFSKLQRTLRNICSTMKEDRLESLLLLQCHGNMPDDGRSSWWIRQFSTATSPKIHYSEF